MRPGLATAAPLLPCLALACLALSGPAPSGPEHSGPLPGGAARREATPRVVDLMPSFWRFQAEAAGQEPATRVALLRRIVIDPHRPFYGEVVDVPDDAGLADWLATIESSLPELRELSAGFPGLFAQAWRRFVAEYPEIDAGLPIYFAPSLMASNGQVRSLDGRFVVMFGLDVSAFLKHNPAAFPALDDPLLTAYHELFHAWHYQVNREVGDAARSFFAPPSSSPLYFALWSEGLAALASHRLHPAAGLGPVLMSEALAREAPPLLPRLAGEIRQRLDSTDPDEVRDYFFMSSKRTDIPKRSAYYVGYRVASELAGGRPARELARLAGPELRAAIDGALRTLASVPVPSD